MEELVKDIASQLNQHIEKKGISVNKISIDSGINKQQLYSILRMGNPQRPNYSIQTLVKLIDYLGLRVKFFKAKK